MRAVIDWWVRACLYEAMICYQRDRGADNDLHALRTWLATYARHVTRPPAAPPAPYNPWPAHRLGVKIRRH